MKKLIFAVLLAAAIVLYFVHENTQLDITNYTAVSARLPGSFMGFRILQISDLHDALIGENNSELITAARKTVPDIIVLTGDIIDANRLDIDRSLSAVKGLTAIAPVYYVNGNHESAITWKEYNTRLKAGLRDMGVTVLEDSAVYIERGGERIQLAGLNDAGFVALTESEYRRKMTETVGFVTDENCFTVLLAHRPELNEVYRTSNAQLVLCGHSHGGQIRLPFIGGLYAPGQGLLPKYDGGEYDIGGKTMIVSRGIGNSKFPLRVFNNPELVVITLAR